MTIEHIFPPGSHEYFYRGLKRRSAREMDAQRMKRVMWKIFKDLEDTQEPIHWKHQLTENQRDVEAYFIFLSLKTSYDYAKHN